MTGGTPLTRSAHERLRAELDELTTKGRVEIAQVIEKARSLGDLSENGDYHTAKDQQGKMEGRIRQLQQILEHAEIIEDSSGPAAVVAPGLIVGIRYEGDDEIERYYIGSIEERREDVIVVSHASPLGVALVGKKVGELVSYEAPSGPLKVEIVSIGE